VDLDVDRDRARLSGTVTNVGRPARAVRVALVGIPVAFLALFFVWPVATIIARGLDWGRTRDVLADGNLRSVLWFTCWQAAVSTALAVIAGLVPAYVIARFQFPGRRWLLALVTVPFMLPTIVVGAAFLAVLPSSLHRTVLAVLIAHVWVNLAVVVRTVSSMWTQIDPGLGEAAATLGASPWRVMRHITLPLLRPAIVASASIVFLFCFTSFGIVRVLGGPSHPTLEVEIWRRTTQLLDLRTASVLALVQLLLVGALMIWWTGLQARGSVAIAMRPNTVLLRPRGGQRLLVGAVAGGAALLVAAPLVLMLDRSLSTGQGRSLDAWRAVLFGSDRTVGGAPPVVADPIGTVVTSLRIAVVAAVIAVAVGGCAACGIAYARRSARALDAGLMLPLGISAVTVGFGMLITFDQPPFDLRGSTLMIPLGQALVAVPFVVRIVLPTLRAVDPRLREAAATLGASPRRIWREIDFPVLRRAFGAAAGFALVISLGEFGATSFLTRTGHETAPIAIGRLVGRASAFNLAQAAALATVLALVTLAATLAVDRLRGERGAPF
jgi:thiamine transport system permease protein